MLEIVMLLGALIQVSDGNFVVSNELGTLYNGTDSFEAFQTAISNDNEIKFGVGVFNFKNKILHVPPGTIIEGSSVIVDAITNTKATVIKFENKGYMELSDFVMIDKLKFHCKDKTDLSECLVVYGHDNDIRNIFVVGSQQSIGVGFYQNPSKGRFNFDNHIMKLGITNVAQGLRLQNATQNVFSQVVITQYKTGLWFINSDHNHFDHIHFAAVLDNRSTDVIFGTKKGDQTLGNTFDDLTFRTGNPNIVSNTYITGRPNIIQVASIDGPLKIIYQEGGKPESIKIYDKTAN